MSDEELAELKRSIDSTRGVVKAAQRSLRTAGSFLADLEERLDKALTNRTAEEAQRDEHRRCE